MADGPVQLRYGGGTLRLEKSARWIGVRPRQGCEAELRRALALVPRFGGPDVLGFDRRGDFGLVGLPGTTLGASGALLDMLRGHAAVAAGTHAFEAEDSDAPLLPTGRLFIRCRRKARRSARDELLAGHGLAVTATLPGGTMLVRIGRSARNPIATALALQAEAIVEFAEPEFTGRIEPCDFQPPAAEALARSWYLENSGRLDGYGAGPKGMDAAVPAAWSRLASFGSPDIVVAICDFGVDLKHPDIAGRRIVEPLDLAASGGAPPALTGEGAGHGTACAGVVLGRNGGAGRLCGVAPGVALLPIRLRSDPTDMELIRAFDHAALHGASVMNCSWQLRDGRRMNTELSAAVKRCATAGGPDGRGCLVVAAAGNDGQTLSPQAPYRLATHPDVLAVAALNNRGERNPVSNYGPPVWISAAAGDDTAWPMEAPDPRGAPGYTPGDYSWRFNNTSAAAAVVSGVAALVRSARPQLSAAETRRILGETATKFPGAATAELGRGRVNAAKAVAAALAHA